MKQKSRSTWLVLCVLLSGFLLALFGCNKQPTSKSLTVVSFGGAYQEAQSKAYMKPFAEMTKATVTEATYNGEYGILSNRATSPEGVWDVVSVEAVPTARGARESLFLKIPDSIYSGLRLTSGAAGEYAAGHLVFSTVLAYNQTTFPDTLTAPRSWADFWDVSKYPGKRALRNSPRGTLEIALLAAGVRPENLYPLDTKLAFEQLDKLRPSLVFWEAGAQPPQLLSNGTVTMTSAYNGRVWFAKQKEGAKIGWTLNQGLMETEFWVVPKNASNPDLAFAFIRFSLQAPEQAQFSNQIAYGPTNLDAVPNVSKDIMAALPNSPAALSLQIPVNFDWWASNQSTIEAEWEQWQSGH